MPSDADVTHPLPTSDTELVAEWTGQPALFSDLPIDVPTVRAGRDFLHTGSTVSRHEQDAARIVACAALGWSNRRIARELGHHQATVAAVLRDAAKHGKVEAVKDRVLSAAAAAIHSDIELGDELADRIRAGDEGVDLGQLAALRKSTWVGAGILADKGGPAAAPVTIHAGPGSVVQVVQDYAARLRSLVAPDSQSGAQTEEPKQIEGVQAEVMPAVMPDGPTASPSIRPDEPGWTETSEGGGGVRRRRAHQNSRWITLGEFYEHLARVFHDS